MKTQCIIYFGTSHWNFVCDFMVSLWCRYKYKNLLNERTTWDRLIYFVGFCVYISDTYLFHRQAPTDFSFGAFACFLSYKFIKFRGFFLQIFFRTWKRSPEWQLPNQCKFLFASVLNVVNILTMASVFTKFMMLILELMTSFEVFQ